MCEWRVPPTESGQRKFDGQFGGYNTINTHKNLSRSSSQTTVHRPFSLEEHWGGTLNHGCLHRESVEWPGKYRDQCYIFVSSPPTDVQGNISTTHKSASCRGPIGWFMPSLIVLSISSRVATPWSIGHIAFGTHHRISIPSQAT